MLRALPYLDEKWLRADLYGALQSTENLAILWNNLVKDHELQPASSSSRPAVTINAAGNAAYSTAAGQHYCGVQQLSCSCCSGVCRPFAACNCAPCQQLDAEPQPPKRQSSAHHHQHHHAAGIAADGTSSAAAPNGGLQQSDSILDSWLWGPIPSNY